MSTSPLSLADALFPSTRQRVLAALFGRPGRSFYAAEVIALARAGSGSVQRELADMTQVGLLTCTKVGHQKHYQANSASPVFNELCSLVLKTVGLADALRQALAPLASQISMAFVFGSIAKAQDSAQSDVDVLLVSNTLSYGDVFAALEPASQALSRSINPALYTKVDFKARLLSDNAFITRVMQQPKIWLIGQEESQQYEPTHPV
jgi:predicted nucleotidyltransferase